MTDRASQRSSVRASHAPPALRKRPAWLLLSALGAIVLSLVVGQIMAGDAELELSSTSYGKAPHGYGALFDLLHELGFEVRRSRAAYRALPVQRAVWLIEPSFLEPVPAAARVSDWQEASDETLVRELIGFIERGGTAVVFGDRKSAWQRLFGVEQIPPTSTKAERAAPFGKPPPPAPVTGVLASRPRRARLAVPYPFPKDDSLEALLQVHGAPLVVRKKIGQGSLVARRVTLDHDQAVSVYPADTSPRKAGIEPPSAAEPGSRPQRPRGAGSEFEAMRHYTPGDEPRRIDWKASARLGQLVVADFRAERSNTLLLAVDCGRLMGTRIEGQSKLDHALAAAVSLVRAAKQGDDRIGFLAFHHELCAFVPPQRGDRALGSLLEASLALQPSPAESSYRVLVETLHQNQKKRALIVLLTDFVESDVGSELEAYLAALARRHRVLLVGLRDRLLRVLEQPAPQLDRRELFRRLVLQDLDLARETALLRLGRLGVQALDVDPTKITAPLLNRYLQIRREELL